MKTLVILVSFNLLFISLGLGCAPSPKFQRLEMEQQKTIQRINEITQEQIRLLDEIAERDRRISNNPIKLGITQEEVNSLWGHPRKINRSVGSYGVHEQWIYTLGLENEPGFETRYLYFENGILTSFQE